MKYTKLVSENQKQMLEQRLTQYEQEHYNHAVNKELLVQSGADDDQTKAAIKASDEAMATLDHAYACCVTMLAELDAPA